LRRLLLHSVEEAKRVVAPDAGAVAAFAEETSPEIMDRIFEEFNSLSVVYRRPASSFVKVRKLFDCLASGVIKSLYYELPCVIAIYG
jgi:hypothetical protein